ncbi:cation-transporting P-type ATPase [Candidatus Saccharibacteria bacterium]|nr:cation-transporting P-type ATPase [Candidatus Saccharibacteria bacterium]MCL1962981.1 cation-transporting P-type ATPase [Candidatus Saccharibacteria bacterium]
MKYYQKTIEETLKELSAGHEGLATREANKRLKKYGRNALDVRGEPMWKKIIEPFANAMIGVLFIAGAISFWQKEYIDAIIVVAIIMISAIIDWFQQWSTERILRSLRRRENESVEVYRDGNVSSIAAENLVVGDVMILHEGQKVPADARIIESDNIHVDESMLTGESLSVRKTPHELTGHKEIYEQSNMLFSGSFVVVGAGIAVIVATGNNTEFGRLAKLAGAAEAKSPVQEKVDKLVRLVVVAVLVLAVCAFALQLLRGVDPVEALRFILAFAVSAVPESLPIAIMVVLALGMRRMAAKKALVRNMRAIENVGLVTTIATDKTGTLTQNELMVQEVWSPKYNDAALALQSSFALNIAKGNAGDPLDTALIAFLKHHKVDAPHDTTRTKLEKGLPFDYQLAMSGNVWKFASGYEVYLKGAPEKILEHCKMTKSEIATAETKLHEFASNGFRVIALAKKSVEEIPKGLGKIAKDSAEFLGFVAIADELRPRVVAAIHEANDAGVRVRMITGDHAETAFHIGQKIDIVDNQNQVYDSHHLMKLKPDELSEVVEATRVYARVIPEAKHKILTELNKTNITAMTGDGVNDVPALSQAHVGIAMGAGAAIAKDASDIILLDNNFRSIVTAIREGRIILANIRRMLVYLIATNAGEVLVTLGSLLIGLPLPVVAVQILWINLATDTFMVIPLGLEPGDKNIMKRPPAKPDAPILSRFMLTRIALSAVTMAVLTLGVFAIFLHLHSEAEARSAAFLVLIIIQWVNAICMRGEVFLFKLFFVRNFAFMFAFLTTVILQIVIMFTPMRAVLHLTEIHTDSIWACIIAGVLMAVVLEAHKAIGRIIDKKNLH